MVTATPIVTAQVVARRQTSAARAAFVGLCALLLPFGVAALVLPAAVIFPITIAALLLVIWLWQRPARGLYVVFAAALLFDVAPLGFPDSLTDRIPFFLNLNSSGSATFDGFPITPAEILMLTAILIWVAKGSATRTLRFPTGPLAGAYGLYLVVLAVAEIHGLLAGGAFNLSLWELRPQVYGFIGFVLAAALVENQGDLKRLGALFLTLITVKALIGDFRYFVTLHGAVTEGQPILAHEESYFLALFLIALVVSLFWYRKRRPLLLMLLSAPVVGVALLANQRRIAILALEVGLVLMVVLAARFERRQRPRILATSAVGVVAFAAFLTIYWDREYGVAAQVLRPIKSQIEPDERDYLSNIYRVAENANLSLSFHSAAVIGMGFGLPFLVVFPQADISQIYPLWNIIPHNSLLWVGMRMGTLGFITFWGLIGLALLQAMHQLGGRRDRLLRAVAAFSVAAIVAELMVGYGDIQLENYRNLIFLGVLLGVLNRMPHLVDDHAA